MPRTKATVSSTPSKPPLPKGWEWVRFGDVANNVNTTASAPLKEGLERYVGLEHLEPRDLRIRSWGKVADGTTFNRVFRAGQVLFGKRRAYQRKAAVPEFDGLCSGDIYVFAAKEKRLIPELLPFLVQTEGFATHAENTSEGSLSPRTKWKYLAAYEFALPSDLAEQRRIAGLLRAADDTVEAWREVQNGVQQLLEAFTRDRFCATQWPRKKLGTLIHGLTPGSSVVGVNEPALNGKYGVLKVSAVGAAGFVEEENTESRMGNAIHGPADA